MPEATWRKSVLNNEHCWQRCNLGWGIVSSLTNCGGYFSPHLKKHPGRCLLAMTCGAEWPFNGPAHSRVLLSFFCLVWASMSMATPLLQAHCTCCGCLHAWQFFADERTLAFVVQVLCMQIAVSLALCHSVRHCCGAAGADGGAFVCVLCLL